MLTNVPVSSGTWPEDKPPQQYEALARQERDRLLREWSGLRDHSPETVAPLLRRAAEIHAMADHTAQLPPERDFFSNATDGIARALAQAHLSGPKPGVPSVAVSPESRQKAAELVRQGYQHWSNNQLEQAEQCYRQAVSLDPANPQAHNGVGGVLSRKNDWAGAEAEFRLAYQLDPNDYTYAGHVAISLWKQNKNLPEAEQLVRRALALKPDYADLHYQLGVVLSYERQWVAAEAAFRQAVRLNAQKGSYHADLARAILEQGRRPEAIQEAQTARSMGVQEHEVYAMLGLNGQPTQTQIPVAGPVPDMSRFAALLWSNDLNSALTEVRRLSEQYPDHAMVGVARIGLELVFKNVKEAKTLADRLYGLYPQHVHLLITRGQVALESNDAKTARQMFDQALQVDPQIAGQYYNQGVQFFDRKCYRLAYQEFATVAAMSPQQMWMTRYYLGITAEWLGDPKDAVTQYEAFLKQNPPPDWANAARASLQRLRQPRP